MKFPISHHPHFGEKYGDYAAKFNGLAEVLEGYGIDVLLLRGVVEATRDLEELAAEVAYYQGLHSKGHMISI